MILPFPPLHRLALILFMAAAPACMADDGPKTAVEPLSVTVTGDAMNRVGQPVFVEFGIKNITKDVLLLKSS